MEVIEKDLQILRNVPVGHPRTSERNWRCELEQGSYGATRDAGSQILNVCDSIHLAESVTTAEQAKDVPGV